MLKDLQVYKSFNAFLTQKINKLSIHQILRFFSNNIILLVVFGMLHMLTHLLALEFEVFEGWSSWYWPIGVQVACYILLPFQYWLVIMFAIPMGGTFEHVLINNGSFLDPNKLNTFFEPFTVLKFSQLTFIALLKLYKVKLTLEEVKPMLLIMSAAASYRLIVSARNILTESFFDVPKERVFEMILVQFLAGLLTILIIVPLVFLLRKFWLNRHKVQWHTVLPAISYLFLLVLTSIFLYLTQPITLYVLRILAFIPLVWFGLVTNMDGKVLLVPC